MDALSRDDGDQYHEADCSCLWCRNHPGWRAMDTAAEIQRLLDSLLAQVAEDEAGAWSVHDVAACDALLYEENLADATARTPACDCGYPARILRDVTAKRSLLAAITAEPHDYNPGDEFYSCSQAVDPDEDDPGENYPGSGCSNEERAGQPCDCGRDARVLRVLRILAGVYGTAEAPAAGQPQDH
jgi:hypothetical protein